MNSIDILLKTLIASFIVGNVISFLIFYYPEFWFWRYYYFSTGLNDERVLNILQIQSFYRSSGMFANEIFASCYYAVTIALGISILSYEEKKIKRLCASLLIVSGMYCLYLTYSRAMIINVIIVTLYLMLMDRIFFSAVQKRKMVLFTIILLPFIYIIMGNIFEKRGLGLTDIRIEYWNTALDYIFYNIDNFIYGIHQTTLFDETNIYHAHSHYLNVALFMGVPFAVAYFYNYVFKLYTIRRRLVKNYSQIRKNKTLRNYIILGYTAFIVMIIFLLEFLVETSFFVEPRVTLNLFALIGLASAKTNRRQRNYTSEFI